LIGLSLWPAAASGGHSSSSVAVSPLAGSLDPSFGSGGVAQSSDTIGGIALQPDGKIVVSTGVVLARYLPDGSLDPSFGTGGQVKIDVGVGILGTLGALALQPDGKIVVGGGSNYGSTDRFALARYDSNGSLDSSFGTGGITNTVVPTSLDPPEYDPWGAGVAALVVLPNGEILAGGSARWHGSGYDEVGGFVLARYTPSGSLDPAFGDEGIAEDFDGDADLSGMVVLPDGRIVATGTTYGGHPDYPRAIALAGYEPDGSSDFTYPVGVPGGNLSGGPSTLQQGKIVVAGSLLQHKATFPVVARYGANGLLDKSFARQGYAEVKRTQFLPRAVVTQNDGKILIAGDSNSGGTVLRLLPNGLLDTSFGRGGIVSLDHGASSLALQGDGKILVGGQTLDRLVGGSNCVVPRLRGTTVPKAGAKLKASYCRRGGISKLFSNRIPRGHVISSAPPPGDRRPAGTTVDLLVSRGKHSHRS
jgi:uncharacterized delta-60 repeat protein